MNLYIKGIVASFLFFLILIQTQAQQTILFPNLTGKELRDSLVANYKPQSVYLYNQARDSLFGKVFLNNAHVKCFYTGDSIFINPDSSVNPRTQADNLGFNTEHSYPQSKGAGSGMAESDLHHLLPTRADVNSSRSNLPFANVPDSLVSRWWRLNYSQTNIPDTLKEEYSKRASFGFEVRDAKKGDVARGIFYFFTVYKNEAENADPDFFISQLKTLRRWHHFDYPDSLEYIKNNIIGTYQSGKVNPYIIDTTLVNRAFGIEPPQSLTVSVIDETNIKLKWAKNEQNDGVIILRNQFGSFADPKDGTVYANGYSAALGANVILSTADSIIDNLPQMGTYYYTIYSITDTSTYSIGLMRFTTSGFSDALYYWNFNNNPPESGQQWNDTLSANTGNGILINNFLDAQSFQGSVLNTLNNDISGGSFVARGASNNNLFIEFLVPTTNHKNIVFSYATRGTATGYNTQSIFYSIDGVHFDSITTFSLSNFDWLTRTINFTSIEEANDNPDFRIRIRVDGATHASGNNRFDNFKITGNELDFSIKKNTGNVHINIYPNPASDKINISIDSNNCQTYTIQLYNYSGSLVYSNTTLKNTVEVNTKNFSKGLYIIHIHTKTTTYKEKIIIF